MQAVLPTPYEQIPYPASCYAQSHPNRLETLARLFGLNAPDIRHCRVLELGCADGSNLLPMACALPEGTFVGVDLTARHVAAGQETIRELGIKNAELRHCDILDIDASFGQFDYIIVHGIYSWVPPEVQEKILRVCGEQLSPTGVAYVSYNTYPGWRMRGMLRDMMLYHSRKFSDVRKQIEQARALINWLTEVVASENSPYSMLLKRELELMKEWRDDYFRHDSLGEINEPLYFHQFAERAERHGLQYLAEAEFSTMISGNYAWPVDETLNRISRDIIETEQYMDFLRNRMFRHTLLCRRGIRLNRSLGPWTVRAFYCAAFVRPDSTEPEIDSEKPETFHGPRDLTITSVRPIAKAALCCLGQAWPKPLSFTDLLADARSRLRSAARQNSEAESDVDALGSALLTAYSKSLCEFQVHDAAFVTSPSHHPEACPLVRLQASRGRSVTNRRHERIELDSFSRHLLPLVDGTRDRDSLADALIALATAGSLTVSVEDKPVHDPQRLREILPAELDRKLSQLARFALLVH